MSTARFLVGDVFERLAELPDNSVDIVLTSPPFLALRSYLPADHPDKAKEIGSEPTPSEFLDTLLALTAEWDRVLAPHGSICVELGDTYAGSGGAGGDYSPGGQRDGQPSGWKQANQRRDKEQMPDGRARTGRTTERKPKTMSRKVPGWPMDKSLCGIPHLYHLSLAYGINILTGEPSPAGCWRVRNVVAWCRPNPPVGALGDKVRPATSYMTIACRARDRYFDLDAIREPASPNTNPRTARGVEERPNDGKTSPDGNRDSLAIQHKHDTAPPLDHWWFDDVFDQDAWHISTQPYKGSHYATWPPALCTKPIRSMCPLRVCTVCGEPSRRIVGDATYRNDDGSERQTLDEAWRHGRVGLKGDHLGKAGHLTRSVETTGWSDCEHNAWRTGVVLDPFAGSGTTLAVATGEGRDAIGIDLDDRNADLARERVGMFLTVEEPTRDATA